ncbi:MAG: helix-turn-helix transcriptional regulator, partial [Clostridia bacterium]|nr:helix-turn-helix transcriptional regulator [Clostridia bacterium]
SSIRIWPSDVAAHYDSHVHSAVEIILPDRGASVYHLPDQTYRVKPGQVLIVPSGCPHTLTEAADTLRYLILFEPNAFYNLQDMASISAMTQRPIYLCEDNEITGPVRELLKKTVECYFSREGMWNTMCYSYLLQLYALLGREYLLKAVPDAPKVRRSIDPELMNSAMTYIAEHYMNELPLEEVAAFTGFSKYYFSRVFKEFAGVSFTEYLTVKRVNAAANLLIHSDKPIREVVAEAGFGSIATFNRIFRAHKHCTPTQFRTIYGAASLRSL